MCDFVKFMFSKKATKIDKSSPKIWHLLHNVKSTVKISSIFAAFLENMNFIRKTDIVAYHNATMVMV